MRASILSVYISMVFAFLLATEAQGHPIACGAYFGAGADASRHKLIQAALALRADDTTISGPTAFLGWGDSGNAYRVNDHGQDRILKTFFPSSSALGMEPGPGEIEALAIQEELARRGFAPRIRAWFGHELASRWVATHERDLQLLRPSTLGIRGGRILRYAVLMDEAHGIQVKYPGSARITMTRSAYRRAEATLLVIGSILEQIGALAIDIDFFVDHNGEIAVIDLAKYRFRTVESSALPGARAGERFAKDAREKLEVLVRRQHIILVDD